MSYLATRNRLSGKQLVKQFWNIPNGIKEQLAKYYVRMWTGRYVRSIIFPCDTDTGDNSDNHCIEHDNVTYHVVWLTPALEAIDSKYVGLSFRASAKYGNYVLIKAWKGRE